MSIILKIVQNILFGGIFLFTLFILLKKIVIINRKNNNYSIDNIKKVPKHMVIAFRGCEVNENGVLYLLYKSCCILKKLGVEYVTIFEPNGIAESKLSIFLNKEEELPKNLRFLSKNDSSNDFFNKIQNLVRNKCNSDSDEITYKELYNILNSGGNWPVANCIVILRNMPFDIPLRDLNSILVIMKRFREYSASLCCKLFNVASLGSWGEIPLIFLQHAEIYELWGYDIKNIEKSLFLYSNTQQRHGK